MQVAALHSCIPAQKGTGLLAAPACCTHKFWGILWLFGINLVQGDFKVSLFGCLLLEVSC